MSYTPLDRRLDGGPEARAAKGATSAASHPSYQSTEQIAWSRALANGDERAFELLVERESPRVFRTCYRVLGRIDEAEDATQEAFVLAYRALGTFRGDGHPAAWLMRIATREAWRRAAQRRRQRAGIAALDEASLATMGTGVDPVAEAIRTEERERVRQAVGCLPEPYREVISLRFFGELSLLEVCAATGRPEGTVKAQLHRGLQRLQAQLTGAGR
jgi:RNA polymerase sigma-70 factor, ECF subfamily